MLKTSLNTKSILLLNFKLCMSCCRCSSFTSFTSLTNTKSSLTIVPKKSLNTSSSTSYFPILLRRLKTPNSGSILLDSSKKFQLQQVLWSLWRESERHTQNQSFKVHSSSYSTCAYGKCRNKFSIGYGIINFCSLSCPCPGHRRPIFVPIMSSSNPVPMSAGSAGASAAINFGTLCLSPPMSLSLSLSSSPSQLSGSLTPTSSMYLLSGEASDDIVALSAGFDRKRTLRRRLSTAAEFPGTTDNSGTPGGSDDREHRDRDRLLQRKDSITEVFEESSEIAVPGLDQLSLEEGDEESASIAAKAKLAQVLDQLHKIIGYSGRSISQMIVEKSAKELCTAYDELEDNDKYQFFNVLAEKYYVDHGIVKSISKNISECNDPNALISLQDKLRSALVPKYQWLFSQIGRLEGGVKFLVDFRTDLSELTQKYADKSSPSSSHLKTMNSSLKDLISAWFGVGFLNLERVTWQSPCDMLQKISEYEAVHPMRNWTDLKRRVGNYRRCFVYTHPSMKGEPVVVLHTALTDHIPSNIGSIVVNSRMRMMSVDSNADLGSASTGTHEDARNITAAIFYSITSTQKGLAGIELGNYLIKRVVRELQKEFPKINIFSSLSPIPGFRNWLISELKSAQEPSYRQALFTAAEMITFGNLLGEKEWLKKLQILISQNDWAEEEELADALENFLMRQCAKYLVCVKRRGFAMNSVAHFHLKNGAVVWRLNWKANLKPRGLTESCGIMVNYRYFLDDCETNSQNYMENQEIKTSDTLRHLVKLSTPNPNGNSQNLSKI